MKKSFFLILSLSLILIACEKDDSVVSSDETIEYAQTERNSVELSILLQDDDLTFSDSFEIQDLDETEEYDHRLYTLIDHTRVRGNFTTQNATQAYFWVEEKQGRTSGYGYSRGTLALTLDLSTIDVAANESLVGGKIVSVTNNAGYSGIQIGNYLYFKVIDNGLGPLEKADQYSQALLVSTRDVGKYLSSEVMIPSYFNNGRAITWEQRGMLEIVDGGDIAVEHLGQRAAPAALSEF